VKKGGKWQMLLLFLRILNFALLQKNQACWDWCTCNISTGWNNIWIIFAHISFIFRIFIVHKMWKKGENDKYMTIPFANLYPFCWYFIHLIEHIFFCFRMKFKILTIKKVLWKNILSLIYSTFRGLLPP